MTIREVLKADWDVDRIDITVRDAKTTKYIMRYCIGRDVEAGRSERFLYESECGDVYGSSGMRTLYIKRIIQQCQLPDLLKSQPVLRGVLDKEIPKELLELTITSMKPYHCGWSNGLHGYRFDCYVDSWNGILGENIRIETEEVN